MSPNYLNFNFKKEEKFAWHYNITSPLCRIIIERGRQIIIIIKTHADLSQSMKSSIRESIQSVIFLRISLTRRLVRSFRHLRATRKFNRGLRVRPSESSYGRKKKGRATYGSYAGIAQGRNILRTSCLFPRGSR